MIRILILALLALAACGGADSGPGGGGGKGDQLCRIYGGGEACTDIALRLWEENGEICASYRPHPRSAPEVQLVDCVPEDWPGDNFCWRTDDSAKDYNCNEYAVPVGCMFIRPRPEIEMIAGEQSLGCRGQGDCIQNAIDNPVCCETTPRPERKPVWDCAE